MSGVTIISPDTAFAERVGTLLGLGKPTRRVWEDDWASPVQAVEEALLSDPDVIVVGPDIDRFSTQLDIISRLEARRADVAVVAVGAVTGDFALAAMRAGARDVVSADTDDDLLLEALQRARAAVDRRRTSVHGHDEQIRRRVIAVLSPKGGSGKTTLSTNLGVGLARAGVGPVLLVDLDLQFGDVCGALGLEPEQDIADAARVPMLDRTTLKMFLTTHHSGLHVLAPPRSLADADDLTGDQLKSVFGLLVEEFPWIVVDTSAGIDEAAVVAMEFATDLVFVASTDVPAVRALRRQVEALDRIHMTSPKRHLVLNRADARVGLDADDIGATVGLEVDAKIPSSRSVPIATNQGRPVIETNSRDSVGRAFAQVVHSFLPSGAREADTRRWRW